MGAAYLTSSTPTPDPATTLLRELTAIGIPTTADAIHDRRARHLLWYRVQGAHDIAVVKRDWALAQRLARASLALTELDCGMRGK